jgi:hypothetical protein
MKVVNICFPDQTHGKFPVSASTTFGELLEKALKKRGLAVAAHELVVEGRSADPGALAATCCGQRVEVREISSGLRLSAQHSKQAMLDKTKSVGDVGSGGACSFCGSELVDGENDAQLGDMKFHASCFKCSM